MTIGAFPGVPEDFEPAPFGFAKRILVACQKVVDAGVEGAEHRLPEKLDQRPVSVVGQLAVVPEDVLSAVAVMNVEVEYCDPLHSVLRQCMSRPGRNVAEQAKAHGAVALGMVPRRTCTTEGVVQFTADDTIGGIQHGANRRERRLQRVRVHCGVAIEMSQAAGRRE